MNQITGEIDNWGCPIFEIIILNGKDNSKWVKSTAVIDTGAFDFCIKKNIIESLELPLVGSAKIMHPTEKIVETGIYHADLLLTQKLLVKDMMSKVLILDNYPYDTIIGTAFLKGKSFFYNTLLKSWKINW